MKPEQQERFKDSAVKYMRSLTENSALTEVHYNFKSANFKHEINVYFYQHNQWYFEVRYQKEFDKTLRFSVRTNRELSFWFDFKESEIDLFLSDIEEYYELWLMNLEKKKRGAEEEALHYHKNKVRELEARGTK